MKLRKNTLRPLEFRITARPNERMQAATESKGHGEDILQRWRAWENSEANSVDRFVRRPETLLNEYSHNRHGGVLGRFFRIANRWQSEVDRIVVLSSGDAALGAQAIVEGCCQPYWNELSRADRGSKPRIYWVDDGTDSDGLQGLLHVLRTSDRTTEDSIHRQWGLIVIDPHGCDLERLWQVRPLLQLLEPSSRNGDVGLGERLIVVHGHHGEAVELLTSEQPAECFSLADEPDGNHVFDPCGLLPAAMLGVNVMELVYAAYWVSKVMHEGPDNSNLALPLVSMLRANSVSSSEGSLASLHWNNPYLGLRGFVRWASALLPATRIASESLTLGISVKDSRFDPLIESNEVCGQGPLVSAMCEEEGIRAEFTMPIIDELHLGQLLQWWMVTSQWLQLPKE